MDEVTVSPNGTTPAMTQVVDVLRDAIAAHVARRDQLVEELTAVKHELTNYQKALELLSGEPRVKQPGPGRPKRSNGTKVGPERLAEIERAIRQWAEEHDGNEFRQIDIREFMDNAITSGVSSFAFKELREQNVIRVSRKDGNNLYFRLTRQAQSEH